MSRAIALRRLEPEPPRPVVEEPVDLQVPLAPPPSSPVGILCSGWNFYAELPVASSFGGAPAQTYAQALEGMMASAQAAQQAWAQVGQAGEQAAVAIVDGLGPALQQASAQIAAALPAPFGPGGPSQEPAYGPYDEYDEAVMDGD